MNRQLSLLLFLVSINLLNAQDTINKRALYLNLGADATLLTCSYFFLDKAWYQDFDRAPMHWFDDTKEWFGMDKIGHAFTSYQLSTLYAWQIKSTGLDTKKSVVIGSILGFSTMSMIELLDARSSAWGASLSDLGANALGMCLYMSQQLLWQETRIDFKLSYHHTQYAQYRPQLLGKDCKERMLKDYNGHTAWLSASPNDFGVDWWPSLLNIAVGYGVEGMTGAHENIFIQNTNFTRQRQYYLSLDINLSKIKTNNRLLKTLFSVFNSIKVPMPTLEYSNHQMRGHYLYF